MASLPQTTFAAGEIAPALQGRVDLARYLTALKKCRNFTTLPFGGARNRAGTRFISETRNNLRARLVRFKFNSQDTYCLEFTSGGIRFYRNGGLVLGAGSVPYVVASPYQDADLFELVFAQSADVMDIVHPNYPPMQLRRYDHANWTLTNTNLAPSISAPASCSATSGGGTGAQQTWSYRVTAVRDDGSTVIEESLPATSNTINVFADTLTGTVTWPGVSGANYYNVYKDNAGAGIYGFIGRSTTGTFVDKNITPNKNDTPPTGLNPFPGAGSYPDCVAYYQQRKVFGGSDLKPQSLWFSKTGVFNNFGYSTPLKDDDSITWSMASDQVNRVRHLLALKDLLTFTDGAEWTVSGSSSGFTPSTINGNPQTYNGIGDVPPLVVNNNVLYVQERGAAVTSFSYQLSADSFVGSDVSLLSQHLLREHTIVDWSYQKIPDSIVWPTREDGVALGLTYTPEQEVAGWHWHDTDGQIVSVCAVPEGIEDALYWCVLRTINGAPHYYVERMESRNLPHATDGTPIISLSYFVDCGLTYNGTATDGSTVTLTGGSTWQSPEVLTCTRSKGVWTSAAVGTQIHIVDPTTNTKIRLDVESFIDATHLRVRCLGQVPTYLRGNPSGVWGTAVGRLVGLSHLEGKVVSILGDGNVLTQQTVSGGAINLSQKCLIATAGLPYVADLQTLECTNPAGETLQDKHKTIGSLVLVVEESRAVWAGSDADHLWEFKQREFEDYNQGIQPLTGKAVINITNDWEGAGSIFIRQIDPLPLSILDVIPDVIAGGKL